LEYLGTTVDDLLDARLLLEPVAAALAAERIDEAGIDRLRAAVDAEQQNTAGRSAACADFHAALAEQSKNPVLQLFIDILIRLTHRFRPTPSRPAAPSGSAPGERHAGDLWVDSGSGDVETIDRTCGVHLDIVTAVAAGDSAGAKTLSERHAESVTARLRGHDLGGDATPRPVRKPRGLDCDAASGKIAEVLAAAIRDDIAAGGWQVGSVFGTEVALLQRYRVSRSALREAVRLLEYHSVVRTRRGPGGGLVVAKPQAQASIDTIALYLEYRKPCREDLWLVRDAIEVENVAKVVKRRDAPEVRAFLDTHRRVIEQAGDDVHKADMEEFLFHTGLAQLAGNAVLDLFLRILIELFRRHWASTEQNLPSCSDLGDVQRAHLRVIEAIVDGDDGLARHRTRRHLDAAASRWL
jgi:DNA-binding FadR family transcriptional regulator